MDTTSSGGKLIFHVFGALAEFEREIIRERTQAGLAAARARGRLGGRPLVMDERKVKMAQSLMKAPKNIHKKERVSPLPQNPPSVVQYPDCEHRKPSVHLHILMCLFQPQQILEANNFPVIPVGDLQPLFMRIHLCYEAANSSGP